jgi:hypothetical protein
VHPSSRCGVRSWLGPHRRSEELYSCSSFVPRPGNSLLYPRPVSTMSLPYGGIPRGGGEGVRAGTSGRARRQRGSGSRGERGGDSDGTRRMTPGGGGAASHLVHSRARLVVQDLVPPLLLEAQELGVHGRPRAWIDVSRELVHVRAKLILVQLLELPHPRRAPRHQRERERREEDAKRPRPTPAAGRAPTTRDERHRAARLHTGAASTGESVAEGTRGGGARPPTRPLLAAVWRHP